MVLSSVPSSKHDHDLLESLGKVENTLSSGHPFLVADKLSLADIVVWSILSVVMFPEKDLFHCELKLFAIL